MVQGQRGVVHGHVITALGVLRDRLAEPWTLDVLADAVHLSRSQLVRSFDATVGTSPMAYLRKMRAEVHRTFGLLGLARRDAIAKDAEILVLRHRALIALLAGLIPRERWTAFLVTPKTILDWHRRLLVKRDRPTWRRRTATW